MWWKEKLEFSPGVIRIFVFFETIYVPMKKWKGSINSLEGNNVVASEDISAGLFIVHLEYHFVSHFLRNEQTFRLNETLPEIDSVA